MRITLGRPRYFRPVCVRYRNGYLGGPTFYEETDSPGATPLILAAMKAGRLPLWRAREILDQLENET